MPYSASWIRVKTLAAAAPPAARIARRADHVRRIDGIAGELERKIGLHARGEIEIATLVQRPAATGGGFFAAEMARHGDLPPGSDALHEMLEQHVFRGDGGVCLEIEHPMTVVVLPSSQRFQRARKDLLLAIDEKR